MELFVGHPPISTTVWDAASRWLQPAIDRAGETSIEQVFDMVATCKAQLWTAWANTDCKAALVTTRHGDTLHLWLCGGQGCDWGNLLTRIVGFSEPQGVTGWTVDGRKGWARVLRTVPQHRAD